LLLAPKHPTPRTLIKLSAFDFLILSFLITFAPLLESTEEKAYI